MGTMKPRHDPRKEGSNDPTLEIMANQQMMDDIRTSRADWRAGRRSRFTPLEKLKRHA
jgi:hypothetical protein